ncbi:MAG: response regulator transcription factor [Saprospiraceae bacterium]|nr:response regulator transcription factor [Saprospiraceae bacterium]
MTTVILDDEPYCVELLAHLLRQHCPAIEMAATFTDAPQALQYLQTQPNTELVFMDVEMPLLNAFDLLNLLHPFSFKLIFTTAYDKYAVRAIKYNALDYLLKPIDIEELKAAVQKAESRPALNVLQLKEAAKQYHNPAPPEKIALHTQSGIDFVPVADIMFCSSDGSYTEIMLRQKEKIVVSKALKEIEELLTIQNFFRIHHSYLLNLAFVKRYIKGSGGEIQLTNGVLLPVARNRKSELLEKLGIAG